MANKVIPIKEDDPNELELEQVVLHDSIALISVSKTLMHSTAPGIKMWYRPQHHDIAILFRNKKYWLPSPAAKLLVAK